MSAVIKHEKVQELQPVSTTPMALLEAAVANNVDAAQLEKLMDLQERWEANQARKAFAEALAAFQAEVPLIFKNKRGDKATYAPLEQVIATIRPCLEKHGLSVRFDTDLDTAPDGSPGLITATCYVTHRMGHVEKNHFAAPVDLGPTNRDGKRVMNGAQAVASARSYSKRYALGDALNLAFTDVDDDGEAAGTALIDDETVKRMNKDLDDLGVNKAKFCRFMSIDSIPQMPVAKLAIAENFINAKRNPKKSDEDE